MGESRCGNCNRYLGENLEGDVYCKCQHYTVVKHGKANKVVHKSLYTKATVHDMK